MLLKIETEMDVDTLRVTLAGEFDGASVDAFRAAVQQTPLPWERVAIDLRDLVFMDSSGLHELVRLNERARQLGLEVTLVRPSQPVMRLLELTGLEAEFAVRD
jgi:anti-sigma B factor antagonist